MKTKIPFLSHLAIVDCAARVLAEERPSAAPEMSSNMRSYLRANAVETLRWLWQTGDVEERATIVARVHVWLKTNRTTPARQRVTQRETARQATIDLRRAA